MTISLAMIVKNEEKALAKCLESVKDLVDEIIIVDTGSTDTTKEIAYKYTPHVYFYEWNDDFAAARNFSFAQCTCDFILWLDGDDVVKSDQKEKIRQLDLSNIDVVIMNYEYCHDATDKSISTVPRERLLRRSLNLQWRGVVHEVIPIAGNLRVLNSDISIDHYKTGNTSERNLKILEKFIFKLEKQDKLRKNDYSRDIYYLGKEYYEVKQWKNAIKYLLMFVNEPKKGWWEDHFHAHYKVADCYLHEHDVEHFMMYIFNSIKIEARRAEPYYLLGDFYFNNKDWSNAAQWYKICLTVERPKQLLSSYSPNAYSCDPAFQLSLCYSNMNDAKKALEYVDIYLKHKPGNSNALYNKSLYIAHLNQKTDGCGKKLNLGCGAKKLDGFVNVDIFKGEIVDEVFEMDNIPYTDNSISVISSEHALEHLTIDRASNSMKECYRVLSPGGKLFLKIPDLEECCKEYLKADPKSYARLWSKFTMYGIQKSQAGEPDEAQIHRCGFSKSEIEILLNNIGFVVLKSSNYDGFKTPSVSIEAMKPTGSTTVGWVCPKNYDAAQSRIRVLNVNKKLNELGCRSKLCDIDSANDCDIIIVGKAFDEQHFLAIKDWKQKGKTVYCDLCEDILQFPWVKEILAICDKVICCSHVLEEKVQTVNKNTVVIEDAFETEAQNDS